ncbi:MAG: glycosyltransferase family 4 protein, partial [Chloroflexota bacterium]
FAPPTWGSAARVLTLHDLSIWERPELLPSGPSRFYWRDWMAFALRRAHRIITPSHFAAEVLRACLGVPMEHIRHIPYPPRAFFRPADARAQAEMREHFRLQAPYFFGLGAREPRKEWIGVVRAFALIADRCEHQLVLAGPLNVAASLGELRREIGRLQLWTRVRLLDYVPTQWLPALYSASTAMVFPETYAGYGLPVLEAMACGAPVITFNNTALPEAAGEAAWLIAPPYRPRVIADAMEALLDDASLGKAMRRRGLERVEAFSWHKTAQEVVKVYEELG